MWDLTLSARWVHVQRIVRGLCLQSSYLRTAHSPSVALGLRLGIVAQRTSGVSFAFKAADWTCTTSEHGSTKVCSGLLPCHMLRRVHGIYEMTTLLLHGCAIHSCWNLHPGTRLDEHQDWYQQVVLSLKVLGMHGRIGPKG